MFLIFFLIFQTVFGQKIPSKIDSLHSKAEVEKLIQSFNKNYQSFSLKPITEIKDNNNENDFCKKIADSLNITQSFYKADFDNNGYTDLLAIGDYYGFKIFVVMNYGNDSLRLNRLTRRSFQECTFPKIINDSIIRYYYMPEFNWSAKDTMPSLQFSDLIFKYGDFIEYNAHPKNYEIEKIEYQTTMCFGSCPEFYISIEKNKSSVFKAESYNQKKESPEEIKGTFKTILKNSSFDEIISLLNYMDFPNLKDNYAVSWTDDQTCTLTIIYNNGQVKTIRDYGLIGTYNLNRLYQILFDLRFNQDWK
ncbi:DUF6438 domain-containing protein [Ferruginibacter albus]|uniref:DUF6438 domain-containing protein n=1 Tax=Ferruginibacter albus TaxID=2875540 RepID=UPI001CC3401D|nr:DUF6438 domain-containing protein [Ferruginibacter albus]UAY50931.1 DUF6438 domain-containing protein [Ferruginibacter albus]